MRFYRKLMHQFKSNYYIRMVTVFFSIITLSLFFLMFIFSWQQNEINQKEKLSVDLNTFNNFTQIIEKKVLSDVDNVMFSRVLDILSFNALSDNNPKNPFIYRADPFDTTLDYQKKLSQLQQVYPYISTIALYNYRYDTFISSSGSIFYNAIKRREELSNLVPYHILDTLKTSETGRLWISPKQNSSFSYYKGATSFVQRLPVFSAPSDNDVIVIININPTVIYNEYLKNQILFNSHFYIIDQDSNVILNTSPEEYLFTALSKGGQSNEVKAKQTGTDKFTYDKAEYNIIWKTSSVNNWKYIYLSKQPSTFAQLTKSLRFVFTWFVIVFIACFVIIVLVGKVFYNPIELLLKYTSSVLKTTNGEKKGDIEEITSAFTSINNQLVHYKETIDKNSSLLLNNIAASMLDGNVHDIEELNSWLSVLNMKFAHNTFFFFIIKIDPEVFEKWNNQDRDFFLLYIREQVENYYNYKSTDTLKVISCYRQDGLIPFIVNIDEAEYSKEKEAASAILSNMNDEMANRISIAVSDPVTDLSELDEEYKAALTYFKYVFIYGNKNIFDREKVEKFDSNTGIYDTAFKKNFKTLLKLCKYDDLKMEIAEFYTQAKQKNYSYLYLQTLSAEIISIILHEFQNNDIALPQFANGDLMSSFTKLKSIERCVEWYSNIIDTYAEGMHSKSLAIDSKYIKDILKYIDEDIQNATLNTVADKFKISTAHLSRMFKKQTGTNFSDYVTEKRLDHACQLLLTTDMKIADIVSTMGYQNINYFNKIFKLKYNITPSQYRKQNT